MHFALCCRHSMHIVYMGLCEMLQIFLALGPAMPISPAISACPTRPSLPGSSAAPFPWPIGGRSSEPRISVSIPRSPQIFFSNSTPASGKANVAALRRAKRLMKRSSRRARTRTSRDRPAKVTFRAIRTFAEAGTRRPRKLKSTFGPCAKNGRTGERASNLSRYQCFHRGLRNTGSPIGSCLVDSECHRSKGVFRRYKRIDFGRVAGWTAGGWRPRTRRSLSRHRIVGRGIGCCSRESQCSGRGGDAAKL